MSKSSFSIDALFCRCLHSLPQQSSTMHACFGLSNPTLRFTQTVFPVHHPLPSGSRCLLSRWVMFSVCAINPIRLLPSSVFPLFLPLICIMRPHLESLKVSGQRCRWVCLNSGYPCHTPLSSLYAAEDSVLLNAFELLPYSGYYYLSEQVHTLFQRRFVFETIFNSNTLSIIFCEHLQHGMF